MSIWLLTLLLAIIYVLKTQMCHVSPFYTFTFQDLFNDIRNSSIQWVLTPKIALWIFGSPSELQFPKWELTWECEGSFLHTLPHSRKHEMSLLASFLTHTFTSPCISHEPKAQVVTLLEIIVVVKNISSIKSSRVNVCGTKKLKSNVMQKPRLDLMHRCLHELINSRGALNYATTYTRTKHLALEMVESNIQNRNTKKHEHWRRKKS